MTIAGPSPRSLPAFRPPIASPSAVETYTGIWQSPHAHEREWINEIFGPYLHAQVTDGRHELVLDNAILFDAFVYCFDLDYYRQFRGKNAFLVHFLDENFEGLYQEIYQNFRGVFRCFWADAFNPNRVMKLPLGYCAGVSRGGRAVRRASDRDYLWSFVGELGKSSRPDMAKSLSSIEPHFLFGTDHPPGLVFLESDGRPRRLSPEDCSKILLQSAFSPCPMGNVQLECYRLYEALECGSIPLVEKRWTLDYFRRLLGDHPLPTVRSWDEAYRLIRQMAKNPAEMNRLQTRCLDWWESFKREYRRQVGEFLDRRASHPVPVDEPVMTGRYFTPGWRVIELLRHHDARAMARRVEKQFVRLLRRGEFRVANRRGMRLG